MSATRPDRVRAVVAPVVAAHGLDLEDLTLTPVGRRRLLRVVVDRDGGLTLEDVAAVSQPLSVALDDSAVMGGAPYVLEVTSPGVDRPLTAPRHWRRAVGRLVDVRYLDGSELCGRLVGATDTGARLDVDGTVREVGYDEVRSAQIQVEFGRAGQTPSPDDEEQEEE
jgi:ribosome maturation factor RimP